VPGAPLAAVSLGQQDAELGRDRDDEGPERHGHRVERDPQHRQHERRPARGQRDRHERQQRAARAAQREEQHEGHGEQPGRERQRAPPGRRHVGVGLGHQHLQPGQLGAHAGRWVELLPHAVHDLPLALDGGQAQAEGQHGAAPVRRDHGAGERGGHGVERRPDALGGEAPGVAEQVRQRDHRAQVGLAAAAPLAVAGPAQHAPLEVRHPGDDLGPGDVVGADEHVDLAGHAARALQLLQAGDGPVARHELHEVGLHARAGVQRPAGGREHGRDGQHPARVAHRGAQRPAAAARGQRARAPPATPSTTSSRAPRPAAARSAPASRTAGGRDRVRRRRRAGACAATPSVSAQASATTIPATSSAPKPRTIGTGESSSAPKPAAVAAAAAAIVGAPRRATRATARPRSPSSSSSTRDCSWMA
jgi:hypothetical protein